MKQETTKEKVIRKLTSRKLWVAVCAFVALILAACGWTEADAAKITAIIMAGAVMMSYIIGEGMVDAAGVQAQKEEEPEKKESLYSGTSAFGFITDDGGTDE